MRNWLQKGSASKVFNDDERYKYEHAELGHPSKVITHVTGSTMCFHFTDIFYTCEDYALGKAKKGNVNKKAVEHSKILQERYSST